MLEALVDKRYERLMPYLENLELSELSMFSEEELVADVKPEDRILMRLFIRKNRIPTATVTSTSGETFNVGFRPIRSSPPPRPTGQR